MKRHVLSKTTSFHALFIFCLKKRGSPERCCFDGTVGLLLPLDARGRGRRRFFFFCSHRIALSKRRRLPFKKTSTTHTFHVLEGRWRGGNTVAAPIHIPPLFLPIKIGGSRKSKGKNKKKKTEREERTKEKRESRIEGKNRKKKKKEEEAEKSEKQRREREEKNYIKIIFDFFNCGYNQCY